MVLRFNRIAVAVSRAMAETERLELVRRERAGLPFTLHSITRIHAAPWLLPRLSAEELARCGPADV